MQVYACLLSLCKNCLRSRLCLQSALQWKPMRLFWQSIFQNSNFLTGDVILWSAIFTISWPSFTQGLRATTGNCVKYHQWNTSSLLSVWSKEQHWSSILHLSWNVMIWTYGMLKTCHWIDSTVGRVYCMSQDIKMIIQPKENNKLARP